MVKQKKTKKKKVRGSAQMMVLSLLIAILAIGLYAYLFIDIRNTTKNYSSLLSEIVFESEKQQRLNQVGKLIRDISEEREGLGDYFLSEDDVVIFVQTIEGLALDRGVELDVNRLDIIEDGQSGGKALSISSNISGSWANIIDLVALSEQAPYAIDVRKVAISFVESATEQTRAEGEEEGEGETVVRRRGWKGVVEMIVLMKQEV